jgi:hypothetical protein
MPRSLITDGPLPFCGDRGRSPRIGGRRGRAYGCRKSDLEGSVAGASEALSDAERMTLGEIGHRLGRKALSEVAT